MLNLNFSPFPEIHTERLVLRQVKDTDAAEILILRSDERILEYIDSPRANSMDDALQFIQKVNKNIELNESVYWGIQPKGHPKLAGTICIWNLNHQDRKAEIGYVMHPDFQGKGMMQEAAEQVIRFGFETMQLQTILADVHPLNQKSIALLIRNGFVFESTYENMAVYQLTKPM